MTQGDLGSAATLVAVEELQRLEEAEKPSHQHDDWVKHIFTQQFVCLIHRVARVQLLRATVQSQLYVFALLIFSLPFYSLT